MTATLREELGRCLAAMDGKEYLFALEAVKETGTSWREHFLKQADILIKRVPFTPAPEAGWRGVKNAPDWEGFGRALMEDWPTGDIDGSQLFDMSLKYGLIAEVPGGYNPDEHIDAEGICPETGDPWFEYAFGTQPATEQQSVKEAARVDVEAVVRLAHSMTGDWDHIEVHSFETALRSLAGDE